MNYVTTTDGIQIYYKDWGTGRPIVFSHGWPLSADDWDTQMMFFLSRGFRVIAHDRRGHGRSSQVDDGHDMDHDADDLAALTAHLDLKGAIHVGHSTGGGEVSRYIGRHGEARVSAAVLISAVPPLMVKTQANPGGLPKAKVKAKAQVLRTGFFAPFGPKFGVGRVGVVVDSCRLRTPLPSSGGTRCARRVTPAPAPAPRARPRSTLPRSRFDARTPPLSFRARSSRRRRAAAAPRRRRL